MRNINLWRTVGSAVSITAALTFASASFAQDNNFEWPRLLLVGTAGTASGGFASTNGWVPVLQSQVSSTVRVIPEDNEPMRYRRLTERRDFAISSVAAAEMRFQIEGVGAYASTQPAPQRILWHHNDTPYGFVVSGNSDLHSIEDLKKGDVRVAKGIFSPPMVAAVEGALPAFIGLSEEEAQEKFEYVPASSYSENCRFVVEGKADVAYCSPVSSVLSEMEGAPGGIRWLSLDIDNSEGWEGYLKHRPMHIPAEVNIGVSSVRGVDSATSNFVYSVPADTDVDFVYNMAKWLHQSYDSYKDTHPLASRMSLEMFRGYLDRAPLPVHEGTIKYLREVDAWTEEDDAWNKEAITKMDRWIEAREAAMAEAREAGMKIDFENEEFLEVLNKHTEGLEGFRSRI